MKKTNSFTKTETANQKKALFGLSGTQLKLVVGGGGIIIENPSPPK